MIKLIKKNFYFYYLLTRYFIEDIFARFDNRVYVLSRCACLGKGCLNEYKFKRIINIQKGRIDMFTTNYKISRIRDIYHFLKRFDILRFYQEISFLYFINKKYKMIIMDSFSELVDSMFSLSDGSIFFGVKGDVKIEKLKRSGGFYHKQLKLDNLYLLYFNAFEKLHQKFKCNIYFIFYPTKFESRIYYIKRGEYIEMILQKLENKLDYLKLIKIKNDKVFKSKEDNFPYHFDSNTIKSFSKKLLEKMNPQDKFFINRTF